MTAVITVPDPALQTDEEAAEGAQQLNAAIIAARQVADTAAANASEAVNTADAAQLAIATKHFASWAQLLGAETWAQAHTRVASWAVAHSQETWGSL